MIHDAKVEVTCDGDCGESVFVELEFVYASYSGSSGHYDHRDSSIENKLKSEHEWIATGDDIHYCGQECLRAKEVLV